MLPIVLKFFVFNWWALSFPCYDPLISPFYHCSHQQGLCAAELSLYQSTSIGGPRKRFNSSLLCRYLWAWWEHRIHRATSLSLSPCSLLRYFQWAEWKARRLCLFFSLYFTFCFSGVPFCYLGSFYFSHRPFYLIVCLLLRGYSQKYSIIICFADKTQTVLKVCNIQG